MIILFVPCSRIHTALGAAYGTAKSGTGIAAMSVMRPDLIMKSVIPVVMAGIIAIYGLVVSVLIANQCKWITLSLILKSVRITIQCNCPTTTCTVSVFITYPGN